MPRKAGKAVEFRTYDLPIDFPALLLDGEEWVISDRLSDRLHFHNCLEIGLCHTEGGTLYTEEDSLPFAAGDVTCIPPHLLHTTCSAPGTRSRWSYLFVDAQRLLGDAPEGLEIESGDARETFWLFHRQTHPRIHFLVSMLVEEMRERRSGYAAVVRSVLHILQHEFARMPRAGGAQSGSKRYAFSLKPALSHMQAHYMQPTTIVDLAAMCHLSPTHFRRTFLAAMGSSPLSFLNATRVRQACILLLTTDDSILSIAGSVGFASISSFNRCFQQMMGISPKAYRTPVTGREALLQKRDVLRYRGWMTPEAEPEFVRREG
ncbi:MAG: AraC family transcriptional regulator [Oscillospiraceae bacterium]|jgi:AraC-like DNA-binding protein|nr:AraC family transcriptional regulator [Oscillospiraceae bacterium]